MSRNIRAGKESAVMNADSLRKQIMHKCNLLIALLVLSALFACLSIKAQEEPGTNDSGSYSVAEFENLVITVREKYGLPALGALVQVGNSTPLISVSGVRKLGSNEPVTSSDMWHIGSNAKAMTATLLATFVRDGELSFETRLIEIFPELASTFTAETALINIDHILTHRAGFTVNPFDTLDEFEKFAHKTEALHEQRGEILADAIAEPLLFTPGQQFAYSNTGFIIAAAVAERLGGQDFETLLTERVLKPLGIIHFGFGAPGLSGGTAIDQPRGHRSVDGHLTPVAPDDIQNLNPPVYNSAGNLHITLTDWLAFAREHLNGSSGKGVLLDQSLYHRLHLPPAGKSGFAMGWGVLVKGDRQLMLTHNGSDGNWFADIRVYPETNMILLTVTNDGREDGAAKMALAEIRTRFSEQFSPLRETD